MVFPHPMRFGLLGHQHVVIDLGHRLADKSPWLVQGLQGYYIVGIEMGGRGIIKVMRWARL